MSVPTSEDQYGGMRKSFVSSDPLKRYLTEHSSKLAPVQQELMNATLKDKWAIMLGAPEVMVLNENLMRSINAKKVLDIGVYTGMSAITAAIALPDDGKVIAMDITDSAFNKYGAALLNQHPELQKKIEFHMHQPALETLDGLIANGEAGTFDFAFIDADKENYSNYVDRSLQLLRSGGIIAIDNALWGGSVVNEHKSVDGIAIDACNKKVCSDPRCRCVLLDTGDGVMLAFKK